MVPFSKGYMFQSPVCTLHRHKVHSEFPKFLNLDESSKKNRQNKRRTTRTKQECTSFTLERYQHGCTTYILLYFGPVYADYSSKHILEYAAATMILILLHGGF